MSNVLSLIDGKLATLLKVFNFEFQFYENAAQRNTTANNWQIIDTVTLTDISDGKYVVYFQCEYTNSDEGQRAGTRLRVNGSTELDVRDGVSVDNQYNTRSFLGVFDLETNDVIDLAHGQTDDGGTMRTRRVKVFVLRIA